MGVKKAIRILLPFLLFMFIPGNGLSSAGIKPDKNVLFLLDISREKAQAPFVRHRIDTAAPVETVTFADSSSADRYDPDIVADLVPPGSRVGDVSKFTTNGASHVTIDYWLGSHRCIVTCFDDGKIRKTVYDQIADIVYINENDEKISADRFEVRSTRRIGPFLITY